MGATCNNDMKTHIYIVSPVIVDGRSFPMYGVFNLVEKVFKPDPCSPCKTMPFYTVSVAGTNYDIPEECAVAITMKDNIRDPYQYRRERDQDTTTDYIREVEELMGIDMKKNYEVQHEIQRPEHILAKENDQERLSSGPEISI